MSKKNRQRSEFYGRVAEHWVCLIGRLCGYRKLAHRYRCPQGEIDLILRRGKKILMIEVKYRSDLKLKKISLDDLETAWPSKKSQQRLLKTGHYFLNQYPKHQNCEIQMNVVIVGRWGRWKWYKNAIHL